jgi:Flp pilus assembly protein TadG
VTAEFAVAMPAVLLVLATALGGVQLAGVQLRLQDAAADAARGLGRGESASTVAERVERQVPGAVMDATTTADDVVCVRLSAAPAWPTGLVGIRTEATGCALDDSG